jgi:hypothetical protein
LSVAGRYSSVGRTALTRTQTRRDNRGSHSDVWWGSPESTSSCPLREIRDEGPGPL